MTSTLNFSSNELCSLIYSHSRLFFGPLSPNRYNSHILSTIPVSLLRAVNVVICEKQMIVPMIVTSPIAGHSIESSLSDNVFLHTGFFNGLTAVSLAFSISYRFELSALTPLFPKHDSSRQVFPCTDGLTFGHSHGERSSLSLIFLSYAFLRVGI